jgi:hypothetical protein
MTPWPGIFEQARQRIAHHGAAAMAHMHRAGRVGGDIFDIDGHAGAQGRPAIIVAGRMDRVDLVAPDIFVEPQVDEAGARNLGGHDFVDRAQPGGDLLRQRARIGPRGLGEHHRSVGREIAMRGIARRLHRHGASLQPRRQISRGGQTVEHRVDMRGETGVERHGSPSGYGKRAPIAEFTAGRPSLGPAVTAPCKCVRRNRLVVLCDWE